MNSQLCATTRIPAPLVKSVLWVSEIGLIRLIDEATVIRTLDHEIAHIFDVLETRHRLRFLISHTAGLWFVGCLQVRHSTIPVVDVAAVFDEDDTLIDDTYDDWFEEFVEQVVEHAVSIDAAPR